MCGEKGEKSTVSEVKETNVTTETTTTIRDIGLSGQNAIDMAAVIESGAISRAQINANLIEVLAQNVGEGWQQLVGGASDMVQTAGKVSEGVKEVAGLQLAGAREVAEKMIGIEDTDFDKLVKAAPWITIAALGAFFALKKL